MKLLSISVLALVARSASSFAPLPVGTSRASYTTSTKVFSQTLPILASEDVMRTKSHGTSVKPVMKDLRWSCDYEVADRICNFNRHYAEYAGKYVHTIGFDWLWSSAFNSMLLWTRTLLCYDATEPQVTGQAQLSSTMSRTVTTRMRLSSFTTVSLVNCYLPLLSDGPWTTSSRRVAPTVGPAFVMKNAIGNMWDAWQMENASVRPGRISVITFPIRKGTDTVSIWLVLRDIQRTRGELPTECRLFGSLCYRMPMRRNEDFDQLKLSYLHHIACCQLFKISSLASTRVAF